MISYWVHYDGHPDFSIKNIGNVDEDCVRIEPRGSINFKVKYFARTSKPQEGRYFLKNN